MINKLFHVIPWVPDVNGTKLIHQQWNPPPLCTEFTKVSLRVEARHDIKRSTQKNIANLSTWLHPRKRTMVHLNIPSWKRRNIYKTPSVFWDSSRSFFRGYKIQSNSPPVSFFCGWWNELPGWNLQAPSFGITGGNLAFKVGLRNCVPENVKNITGKFHRRSRKPNSQYPVGNL